MNYKSCFLVTSLCFVMFFLFMFFALKYNYEINVYELEHEVTRELVDPWIKFLHAASVIICVLSGAGFIFFAIGSSVLYSERDDL